MSHWQCLAFNELSPHLLYQILQARTEVFVVEQQCVYQDIDGKDAAALHLCAWVGSGQPTAADTADNIETAEVPQLLAYARILAPGVSFDDASIGRVMTTRAGRRQKLGRELMQRAMDTVAKHYPGQAITIGAQHYLLNFYQSLGFKPVSPVYDEDGIDHIDMRYTPKPE
ncbi:GNAT family N-acetyltransferase [Simiduia sp. 21SJ11W-1]|uniref:GNAT family N-acetyltransferase n=1 Tax=Simiduia sp. 21SJ11W-1 TaxID=2909669 RepID=UPI00209FAF4E|nr:GNAT family N-acetyltransferase [Simiduia sp. 21SJ11W-1]UTA49026.1 GNAT family N-acetyltransferase [Simiduia sp. 21SJ11W-1]